MEWAANITPGSFYVKIKKDEKTCIPRMCDIITSLRIVNITGESFNYDDIPCVKISFGDVNRVYNTIDLGRGKNHHISFDEVGFSGINLGLLQYYRIEMEFPGANNLNSYVVQIVSVEYRKGMIAENFNKNWLLPFDDIVYKPFTFGKFTPLVTRSRTKFVSRKYISQINVSVNPDTIIKNVILKCHGLTQIFFRPDITLTSHRKDAHVYKINFMNNGELFNTHMVDEFEIAINYENPTDETNFGTGKLLVYYRDMYQIENSLFKQVPITQRSQAIQQILNLIPFSPGPARLQALTDEEYNYVSNMWLNIINDTIDAVNAEKSLVMKLLVGVDQSERDTAIRTFAAENERRGKAPWTVRRIGADRDQGFALDPVRV